MPLSRRSAPAPGWGFAHSANARPQSRIESPGEFLSPEDKASRRKIMQCRLLIGVAIIAGLASTAKASIILVSPIEQSGTGLGAVNTVLTISSPGSSTIETGCVGWTGPAVTTSGCGFANSNVQAQFGSPTLAAAGI